MIGPQDVIFVIGLQADCLYKLDILVPKDRYFSTSTGTAGAAYPLVVDWFLLAVAFLLFSAREDFSSRT